MANVHLPRSLVTLFNDAPPRHVQIEAATLGDLVDALDRSWPGMRDRLCESGPRIREHINVFVDGERQRDLTMPLTDATVVHIIPAVAGGSRGLAISPVATLTDLQRLRSWAKSRLVKVGPESGTAPRVGAPRRRAVRFVSSAHI